MRSFQQLKFMRNPNRLWVLPKKQQFSSHVGSDPFETRKSMKLIDDDKSPVGRCWYLTHDLAFSTSIL